MDLEFPDFVERNTLVLERNLLKKWRPIEGEWISISEAVAARVPRRNIIQCCSHAVLRSEKEL